MQYIQTLHLFLDHLCVHIGHSCSAKSFDTHQLQSKLQYLAPAFSTTTTLTDMRRGVELGVSGMPHYLPGGPISPALTLTSLLQHTSYYSTHYTWAYLGSYNINNVIAFTCSLNRVIACLWSGPNLNLNATRRQSPRNIS